MRTAEAGPPHLAAHQSKRLVATEVPDERGGVELMQHLRAKRARRRYAKAIAARVGLIAPNRADAPRDSTIRQNERLGNSTIRQFGKDQRVSI